MILQITCANSDSNLSNNKSDTRDIGFLLHKNPASFLTMDLKWGKAYIFYPIATENLTQMNMILDIDSLALSKGDYGYAGSGLFEYVNDGAFAVNSFMAAAIKKVFSTAIAGNCKERPELLQQPPGDYITISLFGIKTTLTWIQKYWYEIETPNTIKVDYTYSDHEENSEGTNLLDENFPEFGTNPYYNISVKYYNHISLSAMLKQMYVFIMTCVYKGHSYMNKDEFDKVFSYTTPWINGHKYRNQILSRYFSGIQNYYREYLDKYYPLSDKKIEEDEEDESQKDLSLGQQRKMWIHRKFKLLLSKYGPKEIRNVTEIGCGEGKQIWNLIESPDLNIKYFKGLEINPKAIMKANNNLKDYDNFKIYEGSALYRDSRLLDSDIIMAIEVIEHIDEDKLELFYENIFGYLHPKFFILTTPNKEYNKFYPLNTPNGLRHSDHRFEWDSKQMNQFVSSIMNKYDYEPIRDNGTIYLWEPIGTKKDNIYPTFGTVFVRRDMVC